MANVPEGRLGAKCMVFLAIADDQSPGFVTSPQT